VSGGKSVAANKSLPFKAAVKSGDAVCFHQSPAVAEVEIFSDCIVARRRPARMCNIRPAHTVRHYVLLLLWLLLTNGDKSFITANYMPGVRQTPLGQCLCSGAMLRRPCRSPMGSDEALTLDAGYMPRPGAGLLAAPSLEPPMTSSSTYSRFRFTVEIGNDQAPTAIGDFIRALPSRAQ
jgi:hypothetical protein